MANIFEGEGAAFANTAGTANEPSQYGRKLKSFQDAIPGMKKTAYQSLVDQSKQNLAGQLADTRQSAQSRGLLNSGIRQSAEAGQKGAAAGSLAKDTQAMNQQYSQMGQGLQDEYLDRLMNQYRSQADMLGGQDRIRNQSLAQEQQQKGAIFGSIMSAGGALAGMSDKNAKKNIKPGDSDAEELLDSVTPYSYDYKDGSNGEGKHLSAMAQDLEKSEVGKSMVVDTPEGKMVDYGKGLGSMLAIQAALDKRLKKLEGKS